MKAEKSEGIFVMQKVELGAYESGSPGTRLVIRGYSDDWKYGS